MMSFIHDGNKLDAIATCMTAELTLHFLKDIAISTKMDKK